MRTIGYVVLAVFGPPTFYAVFVIAWAWMHHRIRSRGPYRDRSESD